MTALGGKAIGGSRSGFTPNFENYDVRGLSKVAPNVSEPRANQPYCRFELIRFNLHILGPMMALMSLVGSITKDEKGIARDIGNTQQGLTL